MVIFVRLIAESSERVGIFSGSLVLKNFTQENTGCRIDHYIVVDRVRKERTTELTSVRHKASAAFDLSDAAASVNLCDLSQIIVLKVLTFV